MAAKIHHTTSELTVRYDDTQNIYDHVTYFLGVRDPQKSLRLRKYDSAQNNKYVFLIAQLVVTTYLLYQKVAAYIHFPSSLTIFCLIYTVVYPFALGWLLIFGSAFKKYFPLNFIEKYAPLVQSLWVIGIVSAFCLTPIVMNYGGPCGVERHQFNDNVYGCTYSLRPHDGIPRDYYIISLIAPFFLSMVVKSAYWEYVCLAYGVSVFMMLFCIFYWHNSATQSVFFLWIPITMVVMYEHQKQKLRMFLLVQSQEALLIENEQLAKEAHATEMRHMIGNVAHDLKTPLSAFVAGVEVMVSVINEIQTSLEDLTKEASPVVVLESAPSSPTKSPTKSAVQGPKLHDIRHTSPTKNSDNSSVTSVNTSDGGRKRGTDSKQLKIQAAAHQKKQQELSTYITSRLHTLTESIQNMTDTNAFMLMTINRCIDCTKSINGLKLVQRLETVNLLDTIMMPLKCMKNMQGAIDIQLKPIDSLIATNIITDKQWLQENVLCLLSNAVKYSSKGPITVQVILENSPQTESQSAIDSTPPAGQELFIYEEVEFGRMVKTKLTPHSTSQVSNNTSNNNNNNNNKTQPLLRFEIDDHGIGIKREEKLFEPFKQAQRLAGGTGLGLYSLARRIEALGGTYGVRSRTDGEQGSVFWFCIPYRADNSNKTLTSAIMRENSLDVVSQTQTTTAASSDRNASSAVAFTAPQKLNILIVDDSLSILKMTKMMLSRQGHNIKTAENGVEAVEKFKYQISGENGCFDVILMDLQMPIMDGLEATSRIRQIEVKNTLNFPHSTNTSVSGTQPSEKRPRTKTVSRHDSVNSTFTLNTSSANKFDTSYHQLIIGVSANSDHDTMQAAFAAGIDAFIPKPFTQQSFNETYLSLLAEMHADN